jgi:hypothetical protein
MQLEVSTPHSQVPAIHKCPPFTSARHIHKCPPHFSIPSHPVQSMPLLSTSWRSILILSYHLSWGLPNGLFPSGFPTETLHTTLPSPIHATWPAHHILLDLITRILFVEQYRSLGFSFCSIATMAHLHKKVALVYPTRSRWSRGLYPASRVKNDRIIN